MYLSPPLIQPRREISLLIVDGIWFKREMLIYMQCNRPKMNTFHMVLNLSDCKGYCLPM